MGAPGLFELPSVVKPVVLFARRDSHYKQLGVDCYDIDRDARNYCGPFPVVAHPPCRAWGRLRALANPRPDEKSLGLFAAHCVRRFGGVLEHPAGSTLWDAAGLPRPGAVDAFGGWTFPVSQRWWGHKAEKLTWLYIVGIKPADLPDVPFALGEATHVIGSSGRRLDGGRLHKGDAGWRPEVTRSEREATPPALCTWLLAVAELAGLDPISPGQNGGSGAVRASNTYRKRKNVR